MLAQRGMPPPPSHAFAWNSTTPMVAWLTAFRHHTYQTYINTIHSKAATHTLHSLPASDPLHAFILSRRATDAQDKNFSKWQQQHLSTAARQAHQQIPLVSQDYIGIGLTLNTNVQVTTVDKNVTTSQYSRAPTSTTIHLNAFPGPHYDIQLHPTDPPAAANSTITTNAPKATPDEGVATSLVKPGRTLQNHLEEEETTEPDDDEGQRDHVTDQHREPKQNQVSPSNHAHSDKATQNSSVPAGDTSSTSRFPNSPQSIPRLARRRERSQEASSEKRSHLA